MTYWNLGLGEKRFPNSAYIIQIHYHKQPYSVILYKSNLIAKKGNIDCIELYIHWEGLLSKVWPSEYKTKHSYPSSLGEDLC